MPVAPTIVTLKATALAPAGTPQSPATGIPLGLAWSLYFWPCTRGPSVPRLS